MSGGNGVISPRVHFNETLEVFTVPIDPASRTSRTLHGANVRPGTASVTLNGKEYLALVAPKDYASKIIPATAKLTLGSESEGDLEIPYDATTDTWLETSPKYVELDNGTYLKVWIVPGRTPSVEMVQPTTVEFDNGKSEQAYLRVPMTNIVEALLLKSRVDLVGALRMVLTDYHLPDTIYLLSSDHIHSGDDYEQLWTAFTHNRSATPEIAAGAKRRVADISGEVTPPPSEPLTAVATVTENKPPRSALAPRNPRVARVSLQQTNWTFATAFKNAGGASMAAREIHTALFGCKVVGV